MPMHLPQTASLDASRLLYCAKLSFLRLGPLFQMRNPVMFIVYLGAILTTLMIFTVPSKDAVYTFWVSIVLWFTVLFANFAQAYAEERGRAQASALRRARQDMQAKRLSHPEHHRPIEYVPATSLCTGDFVLVEANDFVPADGQVVDGVASVDESAITGESAPVIRESGGDRDAVTGGTRVLSDWIVMKVTTRTGESTLDRMIALVEGAKRQQTPNEIALGLLLTTMTIILLVSCATLYPFSHFLTQRTGVGGPIPVPTLVALLVCLAPTTIGGLLSAIGIAGMNRLIKANVLATSGRAVEAAGDVNVLLLDKTGTITHGNRQAVAFAAVQGVTQDRLTEAALLASLADQTPEGKSIVALVCKITGSPAPSPDVNAEIIPFSADTRTSGIAMDGVTIMKGASDAIERQVVQQGGTMPLGVNEIVTNIARQGGTPLLVARGKDVLGVIHLKDIVKTGIKDRMANLRAMGIKSVMVTGDNPPTAAAIAAEAGVDDFIAQATPETKLKYIRKMQEGGELVAMVGDGTNDAPALAQADVAVAMNSGTQAAKEAANMVDLDSDPTKLIEVVEIGKQLLMTRGALTTFSLANDIAKYFAILPALFAGVVPAFASADPMGLSGPQNAILASLIFNALMIVALIPLAMRGVAYRPVGAGQLLKRNLIVYGLGGLVTPFIGIKIVDVFLSFFTGG